MMQDFPPIFCNMLLPWQHTFCHCKKKMCLAHLHPKANICAKFHENWWKTEEVVHDARFPPIFAIICHYHGNTLSATVKKNVSCTSTPQGKHLCQISWELVKNWGSSSRRKIPSPHFCHNMPLPWQHFLPLSKNVSCTSTPQGTHLATHMAHLATQDWQPTARPTGWFLYTPLYMYTTCTCGGIING